MTDLASGALLLCLLIACWFCWGILKAVRNVLAERAAGWLLPSQQPVTFRLAQFLASLARAIAPQREPVWNFDPGQWRHSWYLLFPVRWREFDWPGPDSMLAELESDLQAERRVLDPVRLILPLLSRALVLRLDYIRRLVNCSIWIPFGVILYLLIICFAIFGFALAPSFRQERRSRRR